jgi:hypothetical protein
MRRLAVLVGLALSLTAATPDALGDDRRICTLVGCNSGVSVRYGEFGTRYIPRNATVTVCIERLCRRFSGRGDGVRVAHAKLSGPGPVRVRVVVRSPSDKVLFRADRQVTLKRARPNGEECEPTCWLAAFEFKSSRRLVQTV